MYQLLSRWIMQIRKYSHFCFTIRNLLYWFGEGWREPCNPELLILAPSFTRMNTACCLYIFRKTERDEYFGLSTFEGPQCAPAFPPSTNSFSIFLMSRVVSSNSVRSVIVIYTARSGKEETQCFHFFQESHIFFPQSIWEGPKNAALEKICVLSPFPKVSEKCVKIL